jgi:hypothetical protein
VLEFTVGINIAGKHESVTVAAEDALIAALKVKCVVWRCLSGSTLTPFPHPAHPSLLRLDVTYLQLYARASWGLTPKSWRPAFVLGPVDIPP